jgi:3-mercaptopyruvate sulfurtransferase SseA
LVSTAWVAEHLNDPKVRLIEVDVDTTAYDQGHIPGAVGVNWSTQLTDQIRRDIPAKEAWERLLGQAGVSPDTKLVFYGDNNNWFAAYAYWVAKMYGHQDVALMNGGRKKWELEGRPLTTEKPQVQPANYQAKNLDASNRALMDEVKPYVGAPAGKALVDVRSPAEYSGEIIAPPGLPETAQRCGHIPGGAEHPLGPGGQREWDIQVARRAATALRRQGHYARQRGRRLLPHRRALVAHLVRAQGAARLLEGEELRWLVDRVGQRDRGADRQSRRGQSLRSYLDTGCGSQTHTLYLAFCKWR